MDDTSGSDITPEKMAGFIQDVTDLVKETDFNTEDLLYASTMITCSLAHNTGNPAVFYRLAIALLEGALEDELGENAEPPGNDA